MNETIKVMTGTVRIFDGYDRWEKFAVTEFGSEKELLLKKAHYEYPLHQPIFPTKKYQELVIRDATTDELARYYDTLRSEVKHDQEQYTTSHHTSKKLASLITEKQTKMAMLDELKIPY